MILKNLSNLRVPIVQKQVCGHHVVVLLVHQRVLDLLLRESHLQHDVCTYSKTV